MTTKNLSSPACASFPREKVESCLRDELIRVVRSEASVRGIALPGEPAEIATAAFQIDSLVVVSILCNVELLIGFDLVENVVPAGGYESVEDALKHLVSDIEAQWNKRNRV